MNLVYNHFWGFFVKQIQALKIQAARGKWKAHSDLADFLSGKKNTKKTGSFEDLLHGVPGKTKTDPRNLDRNIGLGKIIQQRQMNGDKGYDEDKEIGRELS